jgi:hypothetical protein
MVVVHGLVWPICYSFINSMLLLLLLLLRKDKLAMPQQLVIHSRQMSRDMEPTILSWTTVSTVRSPIKTLRNGVPFN